MISIIGKIITLICFTSVVSAQVWPVPYQRLASRPQNNPYCQAGEIPFCPTGKNENILPVMDPSDTIEIFALKKPVWSFKFGPLMGYFHVMHDALGFRNTRTGMNWTMEWYELDQLFNCTFPHLIDNQTLTWCNQGALCVYDGINDTMWTEYGLLEKVSEISGDLFNQFSNWTQYDNNTAIFYETWTVYSTSNLSDPSAIMYFDSFDCASWVLRAFDQLYLIGAKFNSEVKLNYTRLNLYGNEPIFLGNYSTILNSQNQTLISDMIEFYKIFQKRSDYIEQALSAYIEIALREKFYFYFNDAYWFIELKKPFIGITYNYIPLPGTSNSIGKKN